MDSWGSNGLLVAMRLGLRINRLVMYVFFQTNNNARMYTQYYKFRLLETAEKQEIHNAVLIVPLNSIDWKLFNGNLNNYTQIRRF